MNKYMLTLENRGEKALYFEASDLSFPELSNNLAPGAASGRRDLTTFSIQKLFDAASRHLHALAMHGGRIDNITIKIERFLGRTRSVSRYATVSGAIVSDMAREAQPHSGQTYEVVRFDFSRGSIKFG